MSAEKIDTKTKIEILSKERDKLRDEMLSKQTSIRSMILAFLTIGAAMTGAALNNSLFANEENRSIFFLAMSQLEMVVLSVALSYWASQRVHAGYIAAVERRINHLANENLSLWESYVGREFFFSRRGMVFRGTALVIAMALSSLGALLFLGISRTHHAIFAALVTIEALALLAATIAASRDSHKIEKIVSAAWDGEIISSSK